MRSIITLSIIILAIILVVVFSKWDVPEIPKSQKEDRIIYPVEKFERINKEGAKM